tara:strand:- start:1452 stop:3857 length:2406 start_codon:yes stop_codon:yes gene_type:complete
MKKINKHRIEQILIEEIAKEKDFLLQEGLWSKLKNFAARFGNLEAGGKLVGKDKWTKKATAQYEKAIEKQSNASVKALINQIRKDSPNFPNEENHFEFLTATHDIAALYDSIAAGVAKYKEGSAKQEKGAMSPDIANGLVEALRMYVKVLLDRDLKDVYKHFNESRDAVEEELLNEFFKNPFKKKKKYDDGDALRVGKPGEEGERSGTMKGLESQILPLLLGGLGSGFSAAHLVALNAVQPFHKIPDLDKLSTKEVTDMIGGYTPDGVILDPTGNGLSVMYQRGAKALGANVAGAASKNLVSNLDALADHHNVDVNQIIDQSTKLTNWKDKGQAARAIRIAYDYAKNTGGDFDDFINESGITKEAAAFAQSHPLTDKGLMDVFRSGPQTGGGVKGLGATVFGVKKGSVQLIAQKVLVPVIKKQFIKKGVASATQVAAQGALGALAKTNLLAMLGVGAAASGVAVGLLRAKGRKSSRAQILDDLYKTLKWFDGGKLIDEPEKPGEEEGEETPTPPVGISEAKNCPDLMAEIERLNLRPGDVVTLERPASAKIKYDRKNKGNSDAQPLQARKVMVTSTPGYNFLGEDLIKEFLGEQEREANPGEDYVARTKSTDVGTGTGYASGKLKTYDYDPDPYEKQCKEHPWHISVQFITITSKGDPLFAAPIIEAVKAGEGTQPRMSNKKVKDQFLETGNIPEGYNYNFLVKNVDKSTEAFDKFMEEFKNQVSPERAENFSKTIEKELRKRKKISPQSKEDQPSPTPKRTRKLKNAPKKSDVGITEEEIISETFKRWNAIAGIQIRSKK